MWIYLDTYVGSGTSSDPYAPALSLVDPNWHAIDLRADGQADGRCLVGLRTQPLLLPLGTVLLGEHDESMPRARTRAVETRLGLAQDSLLAVTPRQLARRLLTVLADESGVNRWRPVQGTAISLGDAL